MAINNNAIVKALDKPKFEPSSGPVMSLQMSKTVSTAVLDEHGHPTSELFTNTVFLAIDEPLIPQIDQSLSADDLCIDNLSESGLLKEMNLPTFISTNTPEKVREIADSLFARFIAGEKSAIKKDEPKQQDVIETPKQEPINFTE